MSWFFETVVFVFEQLSQSLYELILYPFNSGQRLYYIYILSSIVLAWWCFQKIQYKNKISFLNFLFPKKIWLSTSSYQDIILLVINKCIRGVLFTSILLVAAPIALGTVDVFETVLGKTEPWQLPGIWVALLFTIILFFIDDFTRFFLHYCLHKISFLWAFHKVHHSAKVLTPITVYRAHPVENYLYACRMAIAQGLSIAIGYQLFATQLSAWDILGANGFVFLFNVMGSNLRHSHIWLSWGNWLENWFISPAQHQIHHSDNPQHFDCNLGTALSIWDRVFGTLIKASEVNTIRFGLGKDYKGDDSIKALYWVPFKEARSSLKELRNRIIKKLIIN